MGDSSNIRVGVDGTVHVAPIGTTLPTTASAAIPAGYTDLGFVSEDGLVESPNTSTSDVKAWNGDTVRTLQTEHSLEFALTLLETTDDTEEVYYGEIDSGVVKVTGKPLPRQVFVFNILDGDHVKRIVLPNAQVTERGEVQHVSSDAVKYPLTVTAYPDTAGVKAYIYKHEIVEP